MKLEPVTALREAISLALVGDLVRDPLEVDGDEDEPFAP
jgi:hypothetical protein